MLDWLWLAPALPLLGASVLAICGGMLPRRWVAAIGCASVGLSWLVSLGVGVAYIALRSAEVASLGSANAIGPHDAVRQTLYQWISVGGLNVSFGLYLDPLSLVMLEVVTFVGFLIHLYSTEFMGPHPPSPLSKSGERAPTAGVRTPGATDQPSVVSHPLSKLGEGVPKAGVRETGENGYGRFFCYLNLFVASMLILVLGDSFLSLYLGWEGVGLCSYLLIGFWYRERANGIAAQKAFIVTRVGDTALAIALFMLFSRLGTLDIQGTMGSVAQLGAGTVLLVALLILGGAVGKSAQLPLQTWLPDAMAGPTPVSALIHAATMVTAGVYLIARTHTLFAASPTAMLAVAVVGAASACYAAVSALTQYDIKRVLAYSTISQIGYMFLGLGVGAWGAAIFHFMTHAFFKSLLFLSAGIVIQALNEEHDIRRMGGLWRRLPMAGWTFLIGACSLSALPLVTAGFYSKDAIIWAAWASPSGSPALWAAAIIADLLTALYIFRVFFLVFVVGATRRVALGESSTRPYHVGEGAGELTRRPGELMRLVVIMLSVFAIIAGWIGMPRSLGGFDPIGRFLASLFGPAPGAGAPGAAAFMGISAAVSLLGIALAYVLFARARVRMAGIGVPALQAARQFFFMGWGFDWLYDHLLVRPYVALTRLDRDDAVDYIYSGLAATAAGGSRLLSAAQSGRVRSYATGILLGAVLVAAILLGTSLLGRGLPLP
jgi:NADH-quinone oxidoreductase subunit L